MKALFLSLVLILLPLFAHADNWVVEVEKVDLKSFTKEISKITKQNFVIADNVSDTLISLNVRQAVSVDVLLDYYISALRLHNISVIKDGSIYRVSKNIGDVKYHKLHYAKAEQVAAMINALNADDSIAVADVSANAVLVRSKNSFDFTDIIRSLDVNKRQVLIQAVILELSNNDINQLGVQWALGNNTGFGVVNFNPAVSLANTLSGNKSLNVLGGLLGYQKDNQNKFYGAVLHALEQTTTANLLSMPSVLALDNEQASILVGQNVPVVTGSQLDRNGEPFQTIQRLDVGISLKVTPQITHDNQVKLLVYQEVSNVVSATNNNGIITNKSVIDTSILAQNGEVIVLGGLMRDEASKDKQAIPKLSKIPLIGRAFRADSDTIKKSNLVIFLQPTIIDTITDDKTTPTAHEKVYKLTVDEFNNLRSVLLANMPAQ
ncbi:type II secretion system protein GspD [Moraxella marmotae]|uniref:type II secretion system protein GspD n=1 Tax=Moraxella marmotae TaxID=3344520 RepID=UPI0035F32B24